MQFRNTTQSYGIISILLHWIMAVLVIGLFVLGQYMTELDYYDSWYQLAPWWHKSMGFSVFILLLIRLFWRLFFWINVATLPEPLISHYIGEKWAIRIIKIVHALFYVLLLIICISGYFISTAKGVAIDIFACFDLPSIILLNEEQAALAATIHETSTLILIILVAVHGIAALKHHFIDKDITLIRMLKIVQTKENSK